MIDIHCHILPGIDDGAQTIEQSLLMANAAVDEGITQIIATPHHKNGRYDNYKTDIHTHVTQLNEKLNEAQIPLTILPGQENRIYGEMVQDYEKGELLSLNNGGKYIFLEFPSNHVPRYAKQLIFELQLVGLIPVIVHPERNQELIERPEKLYELVSDGALTQVTASSVIGKFGKSIRKFSYQLIEHNLTHFVASDAHNTTSRGFNLRPAYEEIEKKFGISQRYMMMENAELLIQGETIHLESPLQIKKRFLGIF
ncbi:tyrosine-protein phosphatase [Pseudalkalibacillus sp. Hm43]|uniref:tyrosine-protein phosphatase n=1 Tax=Pseudalkalibacillus sp. Hm43 TaxID=3450742 RepID=UPI003F4394A0